jgi:hypothetical protein
MPMMKLPRPYGPNESYGIYKGLKSIHRNFTEAFINYPKSQNRPKIERTQWLFKPLSKEWIWVNFIQKTNNDDGKMYTKYETGMMKKVNGQWKLLPCMH